MNDPVNELESEDVHAQVVSVLESDEDHMDFQPRSNETGVSMLKMLVSDNIAGAIIGKGGSTINELQNESEARIKVSQASHFYPGTTERTILISGSVSEVIRAQELIWNKISQFSKQNMTGYASEPPVSGKLLIPNDAGGLIIGRGGATIRSISSESGARVQMASKDSEESKYSKERVLTVVGSIDTCVKCTELVVRKLQEDPLAMYHNKTTSYGRRMVGVVGGMHAAPIGGAKNAAAAPVATSTLTMAVPDTLVGHILGKRGYTIAEIQSLSGAKVVVSPRGEAVAAAAAAAGAGAGEDSGGAVIMRHVTISGSAQATTMAQLIISQKLASATSTGGAGDMSNGL